VVLGSVKYTGDDALELFTADSFDRLVRRPEGADKKVLWLVWFHADWCGKSTALEPLFAKLSLKFSSDDRRKWGKVDLEQDPTLAAEFSISTSEWQNTQLPTVIAFYAGVEQARLPALSRQGKVVASNFSEQEMVKAFDLDLDTAAARKKRRGKAD